MANPTIRTRIPTRARKGEAIEIRAQISHDMETGQRKDGAGAPLPRRIIRKFECDWNGEMVLAADWHTAMAANPFVSFFALAAQSGKIRLRFHDDSGEIYESVSDIVVE